MDNKDNLQKQEDPKNVPFKDSIKVDYLIVLAYLGIVGILFWTLNYRVEFMTRYVLPYGLVAAVTLVFVDYLHKVLKAPKK